MLIHDFWAVWESPIFGFWVARAAPKTIPKGGRRSPPPSGFVFEAAGAAQTSKIDDFRPAQKPCIKNPSVIRRAGYQRPFGGPHYKQSSPEVPRRCLSPKRLPTSYNLLEHKEVLYVTRWCFRVGNQPFGSDFGRTATGRGPKLALRPAFGPARGPISVLSR